MDFQFSEAVILPSSDGLAGVGVPDAERSDLINLAREERRVVVRITPYSTFEPPPRHVYNPDDVADLTHDYGASLPWDAD